MGAMTDRTHREIGENEISDIATIYHKWRSKTESFKHTEKVGLCRAVTKDEVASHGYVLTPGRYVGATKIASQGDRLRSELPRLVTELIAIFRESSELNLKISSQLEDVVDEIR
jgi:type I restriction enzyme M protein